MASEITDHDQHASPNNGDTVGNGADMENRGIKRQRPSAADDDDDDDDKPGRERRKIEIKFIQDKSRRHITFSKRKAGIMKKVSCPHRPIRACVATTDRVAPHQRTYIDTDRDQAYELSVLTGTQVLLLVVSETGLVYTLPPPNCSLSSPSPKARTSSRYAC